MPTPPSAVALILDMNNQADQEELKQLVMAAAKLDLGLKAIVDVIAGQETEKPRVKRSHRESSINQMRTRVLRTMA